MRDYGGLAIGCATGVAVTITIAIMWVAVAERHYAYYRNQQSLISSCIATHKPSECLLIDLAPSRK